jgi:hypothetical protein
MDHVQSVHEPNAVFGPDATRLILEGLGRLFVACTIYPESHPRVVDVSVTVAEAFDSIREAGEDLELLVCEGGFKLDGEFLEAASGPSSRLHSNLDGLALQRVLLRPQVSAEDLRRFASSLQDAVQASVRGNWSLREWSSLLPETIEVEQTDCGTPDLEQSEGLDRNTRRRLVHEALHPLRSQNLPSTVQHRLELFASRMIETTSRLSKDRKRPPRSQKNAAYLDREDLIAVTVMSLRRMIENQLIESNEVIDFDEMFQSFALILSQSGHFQADALITQLRTSAEDIMLENFRVESPVLVKRRRKESVSDGQRGPAVEPFLDKLQAKVDQFRVPDRIPLRSAAEFFAIWLEMNARKPLELAHAQSCLAKCMEDGLCEREMELLSRALWTYSASMDAEVLDTVLHPISRAFRKSRSDSFARWLLYALSQDPELLDRLWVHVVREYMLGFEEHDESLQSQLEVALGSVSPKLLSGAVDRLRAVVQDLLEAKEQPRLAPPTPRLYPLYHIVLGLPARPILRQCIFEAFQRHPPSTAASAALTVLHANDPGARRFLMDLLRSILTGKGSSQVKNRAAKTLIWKLRNIEAEQREAPWVLGVIRSLVELDSSDTERFLKDVRKEKKGFFSYVWPAASRRQATLSLQQVRARQQSSGGDKR